MEKKDLKYIIFNKPYGVLCQFTDMAGRKTLKDFVKVPGVYPAGRLDFDSEGLLILTNDGRLNNLLTDPKRKEYKNYLVQVEGDITEEAMASLRNGVIISGKKTLPAKVKKLDSEPIIWEREKPVRFRKSIPTSWIEISIREGMNRQVRKMTASVGFPCLRLIRTQIGPVDLSNIKPGKYRFISRPL